REKSAKPSEGLISRTLSLRLLLLIRVGVLKQESSEGNREETSGRRLQSDPYPVANQRAGTFSGLDRKAYSCEPGSGDLNIWSLGYFEPSVSSQAHMRGYAYTQALVHDLTESQKCTLMIILASLLTIRMTARTEEGLSFPKLLEIQNVTHTLPKEVSETALPYSTNLEIPSQPITFKIEMTSESPPLLMLRGSSQQESRSTEAVIITLTRESQCTTGRHLGQTSTSTVHQPEKCEKRDRAEEHLNALRGGGGVGQQQQRQKTNRENCSPESKVPLPSGIGHHRYPFSD
ncbi:hypothetical protein DNTS_020339, partial [Danionella cerebrum]